MILIKYLITVLYIDVWILYIFSAEEVTGGSIYVYLKYANVMTVLKKKYDFCDFLKKTGSECPLEPDMISLAIETYVPSSFPPVSYYFFTEHEV